MIFYGVVENRLDPLKLGRCQVRVMSKHTADKLILPTDQLPWAIPMQSITSAAMNGIGHAPVGLVPGTWVLVVFQDEDCQQPIMLGTVGGIPDVNTITSARDDDAIVIRDPKTGEAAEQIITTNARGDVIKTITDPKIEPPKPNKITSGGSDKDLPTSTPPPGSVGNVGMASAGIQAIIVACKENGYVEKNAIAAILGIIGGECGWIPEEENFTYKSAARLREVFKIFKTNPELATQYVNNPSELPEFVYGYLSSKGSELGNIESGDGAKYIGRGFIQLTGRSNYERYANLSGVDIVNNPTILSSNLTSSAKVAVAYFKDRLANSGIQQNDSRFFEAAVKSVGYNTPDIYAAKRKYYEYFLGAEYEFDEKIAGAEDIKKSESATAGITVLPGGDRSINVVLGFSDPEGKYPLRNHLHEPDTNRLARGQVTGTCVERKDAQRTSHVPIAFSGSFEQPIPPFAATYPFNKVFESESGSVMEFDDTPMNERVNIFHRSGTFTEIDANGTQVNKIIGDGYTIYERNGCVYVTGECNLTVDGNINILCNASANIEVMASATIDVRMDANIGVYRDVNLGVGRNVNALIKGNLTTRVDGNMLLDVGGNASTNVGGNYDLCVGGDFRVSAATSSITSSGNTALQGAQVHLNTAGMAKAGISAAVPSEVTMLHIPIVGEVKGSEFKYLDTPPRGIGDDFILGETPDDFDVATVNEMDKNIVGAKSTPANTPSEESLTTKVNNVREIPVTCDIIMQTDQFQLSYLLSEKSNITLGTMLECIGNCSMPQDAVVSDTKNGAKYRISKQQVVCNMKHVAVNILEGVYAAAGGKENVIVSSSFRTGGGSSDHDKGRAIDIQLRGRNYDYQAHYDLAVSLQASLPYDQIILEYRDPKSGQKGQRKVWIHISYRSSQNRKMAFTMLNDATYKRDENGQPNGFYLL